MGEDPDAIRGRIEQTRNDMGETIDALGYKADVPARAKEKVSDTVGRARDSVSGTVDSLKSAVGGGAASVKEAAPGAPHMKGQARRAAGVAQENPMGLAIGAMAAGFLAGMMMPSSRMEDERLGAMADEVKEHAAEMGQEALEHGKQVAKEVAQTTASTAGDVAAQHAEELRETAGQHAQAVTGSGQSSGGV
jgi:gas vesicle protein